MSTIFLRFPDQAAFLALMPPQDRDDGLPVLPPGVTAIEVVGIVRVGLVEDEEGNVVVPPTALPGWHVNALGEIPADWQPYLIESVGDTPVFGEQP